jgi:hypothetical protein
VDVVKTVNGCAVDEEGDCVVTDAHIAHEVGGDMAIGQSVSDAIEHLKGDMMEVTDKLRPVNYDEGEFKIDGPVVIGDADNIDTEIPCLKVNGIIQTKRVTSNSIDAANANFGTISASSVDCGSISGVSWSGLMTRIAALETYVSNHS